MTYREAIQKKIQDVERLYDHAGELRDVACEQEKETWNEMRFLTRELSLKLQRLDNRMSDNRASIEVTDHY